MPGNYGTNGIPPSQAYSSSTSSQSFCRLLGEGALHPLPTRSSWHTAAPMREAGQAGFLPGYPSPTLSWPPHGVSGRSSHSNTRQGDQHNLPEDEAALLPSHGLT